MANYQCNAACRHCLYASSPKREGSYIDVETTKQLCGLLREGGCRSIHIGGGEPFLQYESLIKMLETIRHEGIRVEYLETNGFWATDEKRVSDRLQELQSVGVDTLCTSVDPFHAEYIPVGRPLQLAETCRRSGYKYFLWQERFLMQLSTLPLNRAHNRMELEKLISPNYLKETLSRYGLSVGGRAINMESEFASPKPLESLLKEKPCRNLMTTDHFHVDNQLRFIPPGCTGIVIPLEEILRGIPDEKYPVFEALLTGGITKLLKYAEKKGFRASEGYPSTCVLCFRIRHWLAENAPSPDLDAEHYKAALQFYD